MAQSPTDAVAVLASFIEANTRQDEPAMRACLSRSSLEGEGFSGPMPPTITLKMHEPEPADDDGRIVIPVSMHLAEQGPDAPPLDELRCIMVQEDGQWKFDLAASTEPQMQAMEEAMEQLGEAMGQALGGVMGAIGDAMSEAFGGESEPAEPSEWLDADEAPRAEEFTPLPPLAPLTKTTFGVSDQGDRAREARKIPACCDADALAELAGEDPAALIARLDKTLWQDLNHAMDEARARIPVEAARLRSVRIEPSQDWCERCLVLDGPDLVYRLDLRDDEGRYSREQLAAILPGVLAGLPENPEQHPEGLSSLPSASWSPSPEYYRDVIAPRHMRRISGMLAWPIALEADWGMLCSTHEEARAMCLWGLHRVIGALALTFPTGGENFPEAGWLSLIRLTSNLGMPEVTFDNAELTLQISPTLGEKGSLYEHRIRAAFLGGSA